MRRVVSLVPSITETLIAWGVEPIAVTRFCEVRAIATVGGTKNPDTEAIIALEPDVVLMDKEENRSEDAALLEEAGLAVVATQVRALGDVPGALDLLADAAGVDARPATPVDGAPVKHHRVFVPIWKRPWMAIGAGTYGASILSAAGFDNVLTDPADLYPTVELDEVARLEPDLVLAPSEPYPFAERHRAVLEQVAPAHFVDGRDVFWWGARTPVALERLRHLAATVDRR